MTMEQSHADSWLYNHWLGRRFVLGLCLLWLRIEDGFAADAACYWRREVEKERPGRLCGDVGRVGSKEGERVGLVIWD